MEAFVHLALLVGIGVFAGRPTAGRPQTLRICRPVMLLPVSSTSSSCDPSWRLRRRRPKLLPSRGNDDFKPILHRLSEFKFWSSRLKFKDLATCSVSVLRRESVVGTTVYKMVLLTLHEKDEGASGAVDARLPSLPLYLPAA